MLILASFAWSLLNKTKSSLLLKILTGILICATCICGHMSPDIVQIVIHAKDFNTE